MWPRISIDKSPVERDDVWEEKYGATLYVIKSIDKNVVCLVPYERTLKHNRYISIDHLRSRYRRIQ